jgi:hypothetical protein
MSSTRHANATPIRTGFIAETVQAAIASYQPHVPENGSLAVYLDQLIEKAQSGLQPPRPSA